MTSLKGSSVSRLAEIFDAGTCPPPASLLCPGGGLAEWRVDILTGPIPNLGTVFRHRKVFYSSVATGRVTGANVFFNHKWWGFFDLDDDRVVDLEDGRPVILLDYDQVENGRLIRGKIADHVRSTSDPDVHLGKFYYILGRRTLGPYYFSMTRLKKEEGSS